jgi:hypothetical protein
MTMIHLFKGFTHISGRRAMNTFGTASLIFLRSTLFINHYNKPGKCISFLSF